MCRRNSGEELCNLVRNRELPLPELQFLSVSVEDDRRLVPFTLATSEPMTDKLPDTFFASQWTPGAQRALKRAASVAQHLGDAESALPHLFWALLVDEGRAGARLESAGLSRSSLMAINQQLAALSLEELEQTIGEASAATPLHSDEIVTLAREALHLAHQLDGLGEASTDHLLLALRQSPSEWAALVAGCFPEDVVPQLRDAAVAPTVATLPGEYQVQLRERQPPNRAELFRILDAAANRCREGLRVIEDYARFSQNNGFLSGELKQLRHDLQQTLAHFSTEDLACCRDTQGDVGVSIETSTEYQRQDVYDVLIAAFKRTQEALRTLEEYSKIIAGGIAHRFERIRYRSYTLEKAVLQTLRARDLLSGQLLYVLLTESQCPAGVGHVIRGAIEAGVRLFQVREKSLPDRALIEHCRRLRRWTRELGALLIINDRPDIAALVEADGVHVGQEELSVADVRRIVGPHCLVGVSTHSIEQARQAVLDGADYLGVGPTFPGTTKAFASYPGLEFVAQVAREIALPWFAIGGITDRNIAQVIQHGARRVAVSGVVSQAEAPVEICTELMWQLKVTSSHGGAEDTRADDPNGDSA